LNLDIYRGIEVNLIIKIDDRTRLIRQLLGEDIIKSSFNSHDILDIAIGDYIIYDSVKYYVNNLPNVKKNATNSFSYNITFESEYYELLKTQFMDLDSNSDFDLVGDLETFIDLIVTNMNRTHSGWAKGTCDQTNVDYKLLNFSKYNCMQVLQKLCNDFEGEFYFDGKDICFTDKAGSDSGYTFIYKQGLRNIQRTTLSEKNIITRLYAFGSEKNLSSDYRDHSRRLKFVDGGVSYLEKNVDEYGTIEHTEIFEDIYPHREGTISAVDGADITKFSDSGMDFNLNDFLLPGVTAKLHFNSGNLGGYEFEVSAYNNATKEFTIIAYKDEVGYEMPNATLKPAIGDKYVLLEIYLPQSYIDTAETALQAKAQTYLDDNCDPRVTYILTPDPRYFKTHFIDLKAGDFITIEDTDLGIDVMTRIVELTKSVADEYKYTLKLTDHLEVQLIQRLYSEQEDLKEKIEIGYGGDIIRSRRNWRTSEELRTMVFDTDGYFDMGNIRPASVETSMLSVGAKSTQFILKEIEVEANYESDVSKFHASAGSLIHLSIADEIRTWTLSENSQDSLVDETVYYIYGKCTKEAGYTGQIVVDSVQRKFDDDAIYYYFLIGVLHSVVDSVRGISLTYGQTIINGKFIRTGKIESTDGQVYFDLDNNEIVLNKDSYASETAGIWLGYDVDKYKLNIGDATKYLKWDGAALTIKGLVSSDALSALNADLGTITAGNITLNASGFIRTTGKDSYADTDAGFWLGYDIDKYKLNIGDATKYLKWNGSSLVIKGVTTTDSLSAISANMGSITAGNITINSSGFIKSTGKDSYADTTAGFWLGYDSAYKLNIGNATHYLKWTGSLLDIKGRLIVGGSGTNDEIYFKDSQLYLYDYYASGYYRIAIRRSSTDYFRFYYWTGGDARIEARAGSVTTLIAGGNMGVIKNVYGSYSSTLYLIPNSGTHTFTLYGTGTMKFPGHGATAPTAVSGSLAYKNISPYQFKFKNAALNWEYFLDGNGW